MSYDDSHFSGNAFPVASSYVPAASSPLRPEPRRLRSEDLFRHGQHELLIEHRGECYRLRLTRQGKLILNK